MPISDEMLVRILDSDDLRITPFPPSHSVQPCGIDLTLGPAILQPDVDMLVDLRKLGDAPRYRTRQTDGYMLCPGDFVLGATAERIEIGTKYCAHLTGRSTLGRLGIMVHVTAGFIDPGFKGNITLEIKNVSPTIYHLAEGMTIGQLLVEEINGTVMRPYGSIGVGSKYAGDNNGPVPPNLSRKL